MELPVHCDRAVLALVLLLEMTLVQEAIVAVHSSAIMPHKDVCTCCFCPCTFARCPSFASLLCRLPPSLASPASAPPRARAAHSVLQPLLTARRSLVRAMGDMMDDSMA